MYLKFRIYIINAVISVVFQKSVFQYSSNTLPWLIKFINLMMNHCLKLSFNFDFTEFIVENPFSYTQSLENDKKILGQKVYKKFSLRTLFSQLLIKPIFLLIEENGLFANHMTLFECREIVPRYQLLLAR